MVASPAGLLLNRELKLLKIIEKSMALTVGTLIPPEKVFITCVRVLHLHLVSQGVESSPTFVSKERTFIVYN